MDSLDSGIRDSEFRMYHILKTLSGASIEEILHHSKKSIGFINTTIARLREQGWITQRDGKFIPLDRIVRHVPRTVVETPVQSFVREWMESLPSDVQYQWKEIVSALGISRGKHSRLKNLIQQVKTFGDRRVETGIREYYRDAIKNQTREISRRLLIGYIRSAKPGAVTAQSDRCCICGHRIYSKDTKCDYCGNEIRRTTS